LKPRTLRARYLIPISKAFRWSWIGVAGFGLLLALSAAIFLFPLLQNLIQPWVNIPLYVVGVLFLFLGPLSILFDTQRLRPEKGLIFEDEWLYIYQTVRKIKVRYSDLKNVTFYPALFQRKPKDRRAGKRAWVQIETRQRKYLLMLPFYEDSFGQFQKQRIPFQENRKLLPLLAFGLAVLSIAGAGIPLLLVWFFFAFRRFFSDNGFLSRKAEVFLPLFVVGCAMCVASVTPLSRVDRQLASLNSDWRRGDEPAVLQFCENLSQSEAPKLVTQCARFFLYANQIPLRNLKRAQALATEAVNNSRNLEQMKASADVMACASMALGQQTYALKVATDYELKNRLEDFASGKYCVSPMKAVASGSASGAASDSGSEAAAAANSAGASGSSPSATAPEPDLDPASLSTPPPPPLPPTQ
jgi:hypothetical protein